MEKEEATSSLCHMGEESGGESWLEDGDGRKASSRSGISQSKRIKVNGSFSSS